MELKNKLTLIIKTFEREQPLFDLLNSIKVSVLKNCKIVIADDSKVSSKEIILQKFTDLDIDYLELDFDSGLSRGRNQALNVVKTDYFLLLDDDFIVDNSVDYNGLLEKLLNSDIDILSGYIRNYPLIDRTSYKKYIKSSFKRIINKKLDRYVKQSYSGEISLEQEDCWEVTYYLNDFESKKTDIALNFFIGKTISIKNMGGWNDKLKIGEHLEFFVRCKKEGLNVYYDDRLFIYHCPERYKNYNKYRERGIEFFKILLEEHNIEKIISNYPEKGLRKIMFFDDDNEFIEIEEKKR